MRLFNNRLPSCKILSSSSTFHECTWTQWHRREVCWSASMSVTCMAWCETLQGNKHQMKIRLASAGTSVMDRWPCFSGHAVCTCFTLPHSVAVQRWANVDRLAAICYSCEQCGCAPYWLHVWVTLTNRIANTGKLNLNLNLFIGLQIFKLRLTSVLIKVWCSILFCLYL